MQLVVLCLEGELDGLSVCHELAKDRFHPLAGENELESIVNVTFGLSAAIRRLSVVISK
jgi:hypothetical protein